jgi:hypothetical protein
MPPFGLAGKTRSNVVSHVHIPTEEYLSGRILTTSADYNDTTIQAAHLVVAFNFECPELLDDAFVGDVPIPAFQSAPFLTADAFRSFVLDSNMQNDLRMPLRLYLRPRY